MNTCQYSKTEIKNTISKVSGGVIFDLEFIGGGKNSRVFRFKEENSKHRVAKFYYEDNEKRNRLKTEYESLQYLWGKKIRNIPRPVLKNPAHNLAIYESIEGEKLKNDAISVADIDTVISFIRQLEENKFSVESSKLSTASEACFSISDYDLCISNRLKPFERYRKDCAAEKELYGYIDNHFYPSYKIIQKWCQEHANGKCIPWHEKISDEQKILSPSDFGFHNALSGPDGSLIFLDFEYFGWDDPAKMISDFLLHPAMNLSHHLKQYFFQEAVKVFGDGVVLVDRVKVVYPLVGLKWSLLLLNEFLQKHIDRRRFASSGVIDGNRLKRKQLKKSKKMLQKVMVEYNKFPYCIQ